MNNEELRYIVTIGVAPMRWKSLIHGDPAVSGDIRTKLSAATEDLLAAIRNVPTRRLKVTRDIDETPSVTVEFVSGMLDATFEDALLGACRRSEHFDGGYDCMPESSYRAAEVRQQWLAELQTTQTIH